MMLRFLLVSMLALACARGDVVGTPEYFSRITGVSLEIQSPARVCRNWSSFPSDGASVFVWNLSAEQAAQLRSSLPGFRPSLDEEVNREAWQVSMLPQSAVTEATHAESGECEGSASDPSPTELLGTLAGSPSTFTASTGSAQSGHFFAFDPERRVLIQVGYSL